MAVGNFEVGTLVGARVEGDREIGAELSVGKIVGEVGYKLAVGAALLVGALLGIVEY